MDSSAADKFDWQPPRSRFEWTLEEIKDGSVAKRYPLSGAMTTIGRQDGAVDIVALHPSVSRKHCRVGFGPKGYLYVCDDNSTHGTFVNKKQLPPGKSTRVDVGSTIRLGTSSRLYHIDRQLNGEDHAESKDEACAASEGADQTSVSWGFNRFQEEAEGEQAPPQPGLTNRGRPMLGASTAAAATTHASGGSMAGAGGNAGTDTAARQHDVDARDTREALLQDQLESVRSAGGMLDLDRGAVAGDTLGAGSAGVIGGLPMAALGRPSQAHGRKGQYLLGAALPRGTAGRKRGPEGGPVCEEGAGGGGAAKRARVEAGGDGSSGGDGAGMGQRGTGRSKLKFGSFRRLAKKKAPSGAKQQGADGGSARTATTTVPPVGSQGEPAGNSTSQSRPQSQAKARVGMEGTGTAKARVGRVGTGTAASASDEPQPSKPVALGEAALRRLEGKARELEREVSVLRPLEQQRERAVGRAEEHLGRVLQADGGGHGSMAEFDARAAVDTAKTRLEEVRRDLAAARTSLAEVEGKLAGKSLST